MERDRRGALRLFVVTPAAFVSGCLVPYTYPKLTHLPEYDPLSECADCRAFRVDSTVHQTDNRGEYGAYTLTELPLDSKGHLPSQTRLASEYKNLVIGKRFIDANYEVGLVSRTQLRLYCPGYKLIEIESWGPPDKGRWQPATDWAAQENAIDALLHGPPATTYSIALLRDDPNDPIRSLPLPQITSGPTARPLAFAASEYERVAALAPTPEDAHRLRKKAARLTEAQRAALARHNGPTTKSP